MKRTILLWSALILLVCGFSAESEKDTIYKINRSLNVIMFAANAPKSSSNPYDYIKANQKAFDYIVSQGDTTLHYFSKEFKQGTVNGLREYIMAVACLKILGDKNPVQRWETGRDWYDQYIKNRN